MQEHGGEGQGKQQVGPGTWPVHLASDLGGTRGRGAPEACQILLLSRSGGLLNPSSPLFPRLTPTHLPTPSATVNVGLTSWDLPTKNVVQRLRRNGLCGSTTGAPKGAFQRWLRGYFFIETLEKGAGYFFVPRCSRHSVLAPRGRSVPAAGRPSRSPPRSPSPGADSRPP